MKKYLFLLSLVAMLAACDTKTDQPGDDPNGGGGQQQPVNPGGNQDGPGQTDEYDYDFTLSYLDGYYNGTTTGLTPSWDFVISQNPLDSEGYLGLGWSYVFILYGERGNGNAPKDGVYKFSDSGEIGTIDADNCLIYNLENTVQFTQYSIIDGTVEIATSGNTITITAVLTDEAGDVHRAVWSGRDLFVDDSVNSTLTSDVTIDLTGSSATLDFYGDYYRTGAYNWMLIIATEEENGQAIYLDLQAPATNVFADGLPSGEYKASYGLEDRTIVPGYIYYSSNGYYSETSSWWYQIVNGGMINSAPIAGGSITVSSSGGVYSVNFNLTDDNGHKLTGSWSGTASGKDQSASISAMRVPVTKAVPQSAKTLRYVPRH